MKQVYVSLSPWIIIPLTVMVGLFDPDGLSLGLTYWPDAPATLVATAGLLGNLLWIVGCLMLVVAVGSLSGITVFDTASEQKRLDVQTGWKPTMTISQRAANIVAYVVALFLLGSGYWWTGTMWLFALVGMASFRNKVTKYKGNQEVT